MLPIGQIAPKGTLLETNSPDGALLKLFPAWVSFLRKMHACRSKLPVPLTSLLCSYMWHGVASPIGDFVMHQEQSVKLASSKHSQVQLGRRGRSRMQCNRRSRCRKDSPVLLAVCGERGLASPTNELLLKKILPL